MPELKGFVNPELAPQNLDSNIPFLPFCPLPFLHCIKNTIFYHEHENSSTFNHDKMAIKQMENNF
jgi:hypothetical protein